jgi:hypothetical protein
VENSGEVMRKDLSVKKAALKDMVDGLSRIVKKEGIEFGRLEFVISKGGIADMEVSIHYKAEDLEEPNNL